MEKIVTIDGKECRLVTNGATPRIYRSLFQKEVFTAMTKAINDKGEIVDAEVFENIAYCMAVQGGSIPMNTKIEDWLASMSSPTSVLEVAGEIMELWAVETKATSIGKKE